ncbi:hypothetical protein [uncultured Lentibacter sp.]|uniref:hypothetical protein n=1 Tax=uncultured Lentibacter sp. TaxID=1659309 RepID=UPI002622C93D|nr:hypothetical protein [uncultured Lentibacter sp.]
MSRLFVVGDSHARALALGATALGYDCTSFATSAAAWRDGVMRLEADGTLTSERFRARQKIESFQRDAHHPTPLTSGVPVVASLGYHSSQFLTEMRLKKLGLRPVPSRSAQSLLSSGFLAAWLEEARSTALDGLATIARAAPLAIVTPPQFEDNPLLTALNDALGQLIRARGLPLYDPNTALADSHGALPARFAHDDGKHGSAAFGCEVLKNLARQKLIPEPSARTK